MSDHRIIDAIIKARRRAVIPLILAATIVSASYTNAATSSTVVTAVVPSATTIDASGCAPGVSGKTDFGVVLPGSSAVTGIDCTVTFGSSNDTSSLRAFQSDRTETAMWSYGPGTLDTTFGTAGSTTTTLTPDNDTPGPVAVQPDGKIIVAGITDSGPDNDSMILRYLPSGVLDPSFGTAGSATTAMHSVDDYANDVLVEPDGDIVIVGTINTGVPNRVGIARVDSSGVPDPDFGVAGVVMFQGGAVESQGLAAALQPDGKIVVGGFSNQAGDEDLMVARFGVDGTPDASFGTAGMVVTAASAGIDRVYDLVLQSDGKILVVGRTRQGANVEVIVARYSTVGVLDPSFGTGGMVVLDVGPLDDVGHSIDLAPDGSIYVSLGRQHPSWWEVRVAHLGATGVLDTGFGTSGYASVPTGMGVDIRSRVFVLDDGRLLVHAGFWGMGLSSMRLLPSGLADRTYDTDGIAGGVAANIGGSAMQDDGKLIQVGHTSPPTDVVVQRGSNRPVADYTSSTTDWSTGTNMFGACLRNVAGANAAGTWATNATCPATDGAYWNAVPTSPGASAKIAETSVVGTLGATVDLRFGVRFAGSQAPGGYRAPIAFEVVAPNA